MDYAEAQATFFRPRTGAAPPPADTSPARALRDAIEPIAMISFWSRPANDAYAALGLDFLTGYVWGRASVLGEPDPAVVASAFGVFEPSLVIGLYQKARAAVPLARMRAAKQESSVAALEHVLREPDGLTDVVSRLRRGLDATDVTGRTLYAGLSGLPWPTSPLGQLWHAATMLREFRGDGHLAALVAAGVSGLEANILTELRVGYEPLEYTATRGWPVEAMGAAMDALTARGLVAHGALTAAGSALRDEIEATTDRLAAPVVDPIPDLTALVGVLDGWSQQIVDAGWFPPDPYKRASG